MHKLGSLRGLVSDPKSAKAYWQHLKSQAVEGRWTLADNSGASGYWANQCGKLSRS